MVVFGEDYFGESLVFLFENLWFDLCEILKVVVECEFFVVELVVLGYVFVFDGFGVVYCKQVSVFELVQVLFLVVG